MAAHIRVASMVHRFLDGAVGHASTGEELGVVELWTNLLAGDGSWPPREDPTSPPPAPPPGATPEARWYALGAAYWEGADVPPTVSGVLGGLDNVHDADVETCKEFLARVMRERGTSSGACVDCGGGMGRVLRHVLCGTFESCDLVEQSPKLVAAASEFLSPAVAGDAVSSRVRHLIVSGLQGFDFSVAGSLDAGAGAKFKYCGDAATASAAPREPLTYDVVWLQWVVGTLLDLDLVRFLQVSHWHRRRGPRLPPKPVYEGRALSRSGAWQRSLSVPEVASFSFGCCGGPARARFPHSSLVTLRPYLGACEGYSPINPCLPPPLQKARAALRPNGVIFIKDNVCREGRAFYYDAGGRVAQGGAAAAAAAGGAPAASPPITRRRVHYALSAVPPAHLPPRGPARLGGGGPTGLGRGAPPRDALCTRAAARGGKRRRQQQCFCRRRQQQRFCRRRRMRSLGRRCTWHCCGTHCLRKQWRSLHSCASAQRRQQ